MATYLLHDIFLGKNQRNAMRPAGKGRGIAKLPFFQDHRAKAKDYY